MTVVLVGLVNHCCSLYKELMDLRNTIFGLRDKFTLAVNMAHAIGILLGVVRDADGAMPLTRQNLQAVRASFIGAVSFTLEDLCSRGSLNGLRLVMAVAAIAIPLLRHGMASVATTVVTACKGLLESQNLAVSTFATAGIAALLDAPIMSDPATHQLCLDAGAELVHHVPAMMGAILKAATLETSERRLTQLTECIAVVRTAHRAGLLVADGTEPDGDDDAATAAPAAVMPAEPIGVGIVKALFMGRETKLTDDHAQLFVADTLHLLLELLTHPRYAVTGAASAKLRQALPSLFGIPHPSAEGGRLPGIVQRFVDRGDDTADIPLRAAAVMAQAMAPLPSEWCEDPRIAATRAFLVMAA
jgi:hypothetical protein